LRDVLAPLPHEVQTKLEIVNVRCSEGGVLTEAVARHHAWYHTVPDEFIEAYVACEVYRRLSVLGEFEDFLVSKKYLALG
jgi:hypothetical protein